MKKFEEQRQDISSSSRVNFPIYEPIRHWADDPVYRSLSDEQKAEVLGNFFDEEFGTREEYQRLSPELQVQAKQNFITAHLGIPGKKGGLLGYRRAEKEPSWKETVKKAGETSVYNLASMATAPLAVAQVPGAKTAYEYWRQKAQETTPTKDIEPGTAKYYTSQAIESLAPSLAVLPYGLPGLAAMGVGTGSEKYLELRKRGFSPEQAALSAVPTGISESATELIPLRILTKFGKPFIRRLAEMMIAEPITEEVNTLIESAVDKYAKIEPDLTFGELLNRLKETGIVSTLMGPMQTTIVHPVVKGLERRVERRALPSAEITPRPEKRYATFDKWLEARQKTIERIKEDLDRGKDLEGNEFTIDHVIQLKKLPEIQALGIEDELNQLIIDKQAETLEPQPKPLPTIKAEEDLGPEIKPKEKPKEELKPEDIYRAEAEKLGIKFNGMQERINKPPIPLFTDPKTGSSFTVEEGETLAEALSKLREKFEEAEAKKKEEEAPKTLTKEEREKIISDLGAETETRFGKVKDLSDEDLLRLKKEKEKKAIKEAEKPPGIIPVDEIWDKKVEDIEEEWLKASDYINSFEKGLKPKIKELQEKYNVLKSKRDKESLEQKKIIKKELDKIKRKQIALRKEYEDKFIDESLKLREQAIKKASERGLTDEEELHNFADEFLMEISTQRPYIEKNYNKTVDQIFNEILQEYLPKKEEEPYGIEKETIRKEEKEQEQKREEVKAKEPWEMTKEQYVVSHEPTAKLLSAIDRHAVNKVARKQVALSNQLQDRINKMEKELLKKGLSQDEVWKRIEKTAEWQKFTSDKELYSIKTNTIHALMDEHEKSIKQALSEGKLSPDDALKLHKKDYPDIEHWEEFKEAQKAKPEEVKKSIEEKIGKEKRLELQKELKEQSQKIRSQVFEEISKYKPLGTANELALVIGAKPKKGQELVSILGNVYAFKEGNAPTQEKVKEWESLYNKANELDNKAIRLGFSVEEPGRTIGNKRVLEQGKELKEKGLLNKEEIEFVDKLEEFWKKHPDAETGIVQKDGSIRPIEEVRKEREEAKERIEKIEKKPKEAREISEIPQPGDRIRLKSGALATVKTVRPLTKEQARIQNGSRFLLEVHKTSKKIIEDRYNISEDEIVEIKKEGGEWLDYKPQPYRIEELKKEEKPLTEKGEVTKIEEKKEEREKDAEAIRHDRLRGEKTLEEISPEDVSGVIKTEPSEPGASRVGRKVRREATRPYSERATIPRSVGTHSPGNLPSERRGTTRTRSEQPTRTGNYRITDEDLLEEGGKVSKFEKNLAALKLLKKLEAENRLATPAEQAILVKYTGWGGLPEVFNPYAEEAWKSRQEELKKVLNDEEYEAARKSTLNAHYTSPLVIKKIYKALEKMGINGGRVLEPSVGIGHFFGLIPSQWKAKLTGVELDSVSGRIARQLYQGADIRIQGYEEAKLPDNYFDLVISNIPFSDVRPYDPRYKKYKFRLHDYFFAKSLDKVRPGGIIAFITSTGTLDKVNASIREYIADRAELITAIRLPGESFKKIANTEVTTDIIFLRKYEEGEKPKKADWIKTKPIKIKDERYGIVPEYEVNEYFHKNPDLVIGEFTQDKLHWNRAGVKLGDRDLGKELDNIINKYIPENIYKKEIHESTEIPDVSLMIPAPEETEVYNYFEKKGEIFQKIDSENAIKISFTNEKDKELIKDFINLRNVVRTTIKNQLERKDEALEKDLALLNKTYDEFVKKHGYIHDRKVDRLLRNDPDFPLLLSLEEYDSELKKVTGKANIFREKVVAHYEPITSVDNAQDALIASLVDRGKIDFPHMSKISGLSEKELQEKLQGLIFKDPEGGEWVTADEYLSGNVRAKLEAAEGAAENDPFFKFNVEALKKVQPEPIPASKISVKLGTTWIPENIYTDFIKYLIRAEGIKVRYNPYNSTYYIEKSPRWFWVDHTKNEKEWGTSKVSALYLIERALNMKRPVVKMKDEHENSILDREATIAAEAKQKEIQDEFKKWLWEDDERREFLTDKYNREFNNIRLRKFDGSHIDRLPGQSIAIKLRPHQKDAVWRIIHGGNTLLAHVVGSGKTFTMIAGAMELKRLGIAKKPLITVPKHLLKQWEGDFLRLYPTAKVLVPDEKDFTPLKRAQFMSRIATGNWDAVIVTHEQLKKLPVSKKTEREFLEEQIRELEFSILTEVEAEGRKGNRIVKELENAKIKLENKLKEILDSEERDKAVTFEELGIDYIFVDEAHKFKNLYYPTRLGKIAGTQTADADRAMDLYMKIKYLTKIQNGRGVVFATGTPISNTIGEMYNMQRYLAHKDLEDMGIHHFDSWAANFGEVTTGYEITPTGRGYRVNTRFNRFVNLPELTNIFRKFADVIHQEDVSSYIKIPKIKGGKAEVIVAESSPTLKRFIDSLVARLEEIRSRRVDPRKDNPLKVTTEGRMAALDMRLIDPNLPDYPDSKVNKMVDKVVEVYKRTEKEKLTQLIFCDFGPPDAKGHSIYKNVKNKLVQRGIPENEIAFIHDAKKDVQKLTLFQKMNEGEIRILMGSTTKMGEGMNVQKKLIALHHLDAPYKPAEIEQREGRILRDGNLNPEVEIYRYVTKGSFDAYIWQLLENKARFIYQVMKHNVTREAEDITTVQLDYAHAKAIASDNPLILEKVKVDAELMKLEAERTNWREQQWSLQKSLKTIPQEIENIKEYLNNIKTDIETREENSPKTDDDWTIKIGNKVFGKEEKSEAQKAIVEKVKSLSQKVLQSHKPYTDVSEKIGEYYGFPIYLNVSNLGIVKDNRYETKVKDVIFTIEGKNDYNAYGKPLDSYVDENSAGKAYLTLINNQIKGFEEKLKEAEISLNSKEKELEDKKKLVQLKWDKKEEYEKLLKQAEEIETQLNLIEKESKGERTEAGKKSEKREKEVYYYYDIFENEFIPARGAKKIEIVPWLDTFIHKIKNEWNIVEAKTGMTISGGKTQEEAKEKSLEILNQYGEEKTKEIIEGYIKRQGLSPWAEKPKESLAKGKPSGIKAIDIENAIGPILNSLKMAPLARFIQSQDELPEYIKEHAKKGKGVIEGLLDPRTNIIYFIADNISNIKRAQEVLWHELYGHYGPRKLFGSQFIPFLNRIYLSYGPSKLKDIAELYGLDLNKREDRLKAAEEKLARIAQKNENPTLLQKIYAFIRNWLRKMGFNLKLSDNDLRNIIAGKVKPYIQKGEEVVKETRLSLEPMFSIKEGPSAEERAKAYLNRYLSEEFLMNADKEKKISQTEIEKNAKEAEKNPTNLEIAEKPFTDNPIDFSKYIDRNGNFDAAEFEKDTGITIGKKQRAKAHKDLYRYIRWFQTMQDFSKNYTPMRALLEAWTKKVGAVNKMCLRDRQLTEDYFTLPKNSIDKVNKALVDGDLEGRIIPNNELESKYNLNEDEKKGYWAVRKVLDEKLAILIDRFCQAVLGKNYNEEFTEAIRQRNKRLARKDIDKKKINEEFEKKLNEINPELQKEDIKNLKFIADWAHARKAYVPHTWKNAWVVKVEDLEGKEYLLEVPTIAGRIAPTFEMRIEAAEKKAEKLLKEKFGALPDGRVKVKKWKLVKTTQIPMEISEDIKLSAMKSIMESASRKVMAEYEKSWPEDKKKELEEIRQKIKKSMEELYLAKGWGQHLIPRKGVLGYRTDLRGPLRDYLYGFNNFIAKGEMVKDFATAMEQIDPRETPEMWMGAKEYIDDMLGEPYEASIFKRIIGTYFLAADFSATTLNLTQNWTHAVNLLRSIKGKEIAEKQIYKAMKDIAGEYFLSKKEKRGLFERPNQYIKKDELMAIKEAYNRGELDPAHFGEISALHENKIYMSYISELQRLLFKMFTGSESWNRMSTFLAAYRRAKEANMKDPIGEAIRIMNGSHFVYGRGNRPYWARKAGPLGSAAYAFMAYPMGNLTFFKHRVEEIFKGETEEVRKTGMKVMGGHLAYTFALGGLLGLPFSWLAMLIWNLFKEPEEDLEKKIRQFLRYKPFGRMVVRGIPAVFGSDMSWRIQGTDIFGTPLGLETAKTILRRWRFGKKLWQQGDLQSALFMAAPDFLMNPYKAIVGYKEGGEREGVPPIKYTKSEAAWKALGFTPTREVEAFKIVSLAKEKRKRRLEKLETFAERYIQAIRKRDFNAFYKLKQDVLEDYRKERAKGAEGAPITWEDIKKSAKIRMKFRKKGYMERVPKYMLPYEKAIAKSYGLLNY